jgi:Tfp pilus assembly protein PilF
LQEVIVNNRLVYRKLLMSFVMMFISSSGVLAANMVTGTVYDGSNNTVADVDVELRGDLGAVVQRTRTDTGGRYSFSGLVDGRYSIRVTPFRHDFQEATKEVTFSTFKVTGGTGSSTEVIDFNLLPRKNGLAYAEGKVVFAQEVPDAAKSAIKRAGEAAKKSDKTGQIAALEEAVKIFPTFFAALYSLGEVHFGKQEYGKAAHYLLRAADVNVKSPKSLYLLGYSLFMLNMHPSASVALQQALALGPDSSEILLLLGTTEMRSGKFVEAAKHLEQIKKNSTTLNPEVYWQLSQLYGNHLKRYGDAADELEKYIKTSSNGATPDQKKKIEEYRKVIKSLREKEAAKPK